MFINKSSLFQMLGNIDNFKQCPRKLGLTNKSFNKD